MFYELVMYLFPEEEAQQRSAVLAVQREMEDADEPNYLEEEGIFYFFEILLD